MGSRVVEIADQTAQVFFLSSPNILFHILRVYFFLLNFFFFFLRNTDLKWRKSSRIATMCDRNSSVVRVVRHLHGKVFDTASPSRLHMPPDATFC